MFEVKLTQPDGAVRTKHFRDEIEAQAWLLEPGRFMPKGTKIETREIPIKEAGADAL